MTTTPMFGRTAILAAALALLLTATPEAKATCDDPAGPEVDWSLRDKSGADLFESNLHLGILGYANLSGAIWTDGRVCAESSFEACN
jgi:hypothetical protein